MPKDGLRTEDELVKIALRKYIEGAEKYWGGRFSELKKGGYESADFSISLKDLKRELVEIRLPNSAVMYLQHHKKIKGKDVSPLSNALGNDVFRKIGKEKELFKVIDENTVVTCGSHGTACILGILSFFCKKIETKLEKKSNNLKKGTQ